ncbi:MAG: NAD-dependent epimerase/dehydratase family protein, partial [Myxococcales bacterium]|nr:NAD-dependent epimerase/dehydratase family protein [Polyangiaceae bacterium]MDW8250267.1 NAD-dependent epimerase/dehydratase family protein [Myxococcales bacterium]
MSKSVLVTGASGFLGSRVVRALVEASQPVKALVRASSSLRALSGLTSSEVTVVVGDVRVEHSIYRALAGCDRMIHVAAVNRLWSRNPRDILDPAIEGTRAALTAARKRGIRRVVYTSSVATLGTTPAPEPMTEDHAFNLEDPATYIEAKKIAEEVALSFRHEMEVIVALPSVLVGPGDIKPTPAGDGLLRFLSWNVPLLDFPVTEGGLNYVDVDDVAQGHL